MKIDRNSFFTFLKNKVTLYTCFRNHVIRAFRGHFFAKLKSEMAELSSGLREIQTNLSHYQVDMVRPEWIES